MKKYSINFFNIVEIALAIGVLSIAVTILFSMFPIAFTESRKAVTESRSAEAAENIFSYISDQAREQSDWSNDADSFIFNCSTTQPTNTNITNSIWPKHLSGNIYEIANAPNGVFGIKLETGPNSNIAGEVHIWKSTPEKIYFNRTAMDVADYENAIAGMNIEISFPIEKPYCKRDKYKYYFELFNYDCDKNATSQEQEENEASDLEDGKPAFEEQDGVVTTIKSTKFKFKILGTCFAYSDGQKANVYTQINFIYPDETEELISPFGIDQVNYHVGETWERDVTEGTKIIVKVWAVGLAEKEDYRLYGPYWSTNVRQSDALLKGEIPPPYTPAGSQPAYNDFIIPYMNTENNTVNISEDQILYLFELNNVPIHNSAYDMQDMVVLATLETNTTTEAGDNNAAGSFGGLININPSNSSNNKFILTKEDNSTITLNNYFCNNDAPRTTFQATKIEIRPKGNANNNSLSLNDKSYDVSNSKVYKITSAENTTLDCSIWNGNKKGKNQGKGKWWIKIEGNGTIEEI